MADITISFTIPDAYVSRLKAALDRFVEGSGSDYINRYKVWVRQQTKQLINHAEVDALAKPGDEIISQMKIFFNQEHKKMNRKEAC